jgi:hypothetical protein
MTAQRKRLTDARVVEAANSATRQTIAKQLDLAKAANERGNLTALDTARTAITTARSTDTRV